MLAICVQTITLVKGMRKLWGGGAVTAHNGLEQRVSSPLLRRESCSQTMQASSLPGLQSVNSALPLLLEYRFIPCREAPVLVWGKTGRCQRRKKYL